MKIIYFKIQDKHVNYLKKRCFSTEKFKFIRMNYRYIRLIKVLSNYEVAKINSYRIEQFYILNFIFLIFSIGITVHPPVFSF